MRIACGGLLALVVSCTTTNTNKACSEGTCKDPAFPYCDADGVISGEAGTCIAVTCTPGEIETCLGDDALTCNATGDGYEHVRCDLGCGGTPKPHCKYIEPRYVPDACDTPAPAESFVVSNSAMLDPNLDSSCTGGVIPQQGAPAICVVRYRRIVIASGGTFKVTGKSDSGNAETGGRSIALIADDELTIEGVLDVSADGFVNGPGGGLVISGGKPELVSPGAHKAGGGAGGKTAGAAGGAVNDGGGGSGGLPTADPALLAVLTGGAAGGRVPGATATVGSGGGGGAITLVSCGGTVTITGTIDAGGGGGSGGTSLFGGAVPAFGGGAGGYVVLQARSVAVTGSVFANGGGGGTGTQANLATGEDGSDGLRSATDGAAGHPGINGGGRGGTGGVGTTLPTVGGGPTMTGASSGGGGASVGFLQTYTPDGIEPMLTPTAVSPAFQANITSKTR